MSYLGRRHGLLSILFLGLVAIESHAFDSSKAHSAKESDPSSCDCASRRTLTFLRSDVLHSHSQSYSTANNDTGMRPKDPSYLPSGFYDALENPISEGEYWRQVDFEQKSSGVPYYRDRTAEQQRLSLPLSLSTFDTRECRGIPDAHPPV